MVSGPAQHLKQTTTHHGVITSYDERHALQYRGCLFSSSVTNNGRSGTCPGDLHFALICFIPVLSKRLAAACPYCGYYLYLYLTGTKEGHMGRPRRSEQKRPSRKGPKHNTQERDTFLASRNSPSFDVLYTWPGVKRGGRNIKPRTEAGWVMEHHPRACI